MNQSTTLADFMKEIEAQAQAEGSEAVKQLDKLTEHFRAECQKLSKRLSHKKKWGVVVGQPRMERWKCWVQPDLNNVGKWFLDSSGRLIGFTTRREAREYAQRQSADNLFWHFHAKKFPQ